MCGAAQSAVLYQAAFTVITHRHQADRRGPLTLVTLAGGLASTIFAPLTGWLASEVGWRIGLRHPGRGPRRGRHSRPTRSPWSAAWPHLGDRSAGNGAARGASFARARFWVLTSVTRAAVLLALRRHPLRRSRGAWRRASDLQAAAWVLGLIGAGQVLGRLLYLAMPHTAAPWIAPALVGAARLPRSSPPSRSQPNPAWIFVTAIIAGAVRGALTLVQASAVADRWGSHAYGRLNGVLAAPVSALTALSPGAAAVIATAEGSYQAMAYTMAAVCLVGGVLAVRR